jgi:hypothetical protein
VARGHPTWSSQHMMTIQGNAVRSVTHAGDCGPDSSDDEESLRDQLKRKRNRLLQEFLKNLSNTPLAIEIRSIDDHIASLTESISRHSRK